MICLGGQFSPVTGIGHITCDGRIRAGDVTIIDVLHGLTIISQSQKKSAMLQSNEGKIIVWRNDDEWRQEF